MINSINDNGITKINSVNDNNIIKINSITDNNTLKAMYIHIHYMHSYMRHCVCMRAHALAARVCEYVCMCMRVCVGLSKNDIKTNFYDRPILTEY